jgi:hypothetical protein
MMIFDYSLADLVAAGLLLLALRLARSVQGTAWSTSGVARRDAILRRCGKHEYDQKLDHEAETRL